MQSIFTLSEARGQFVNRDEAEGLPLEAVTSGLVTRQQTEKTNCLL
jgi:hypothetical protein